MTTKPLTDVTWLELLEYNKSFLRGEINATFYHGAPLWHDQVPEELIKLHDLGVFTLDGQGPISSICWNRERKESVFLQQRAYLSGFMPIELVQKFVCHAKEDPKVVIQVHKISDNKLLYESPEITAALTNPGYDVVTRQKIAKTHAELDEKTWDNVSAYYDWTISVNLMKEQKFKHWAKWVNEGLCSFEIIEKDYMELYAHLANVLTSMPERMLGYLTAE
jgi:hypothetical protein